LEASVSNARFRRNRWRDVRLVLKLLFHALTVELHSNGTDKSCRKQNFSFVLDIYVEGQKGYFRSKIIQIEFMLSMIYEAVG